jgi:acyl-CoA dehydrogenase
MRTTSPARPFDTPERAQFRETVERFIDTEIAPHANAWDEAGDFPWALHRKGRRAGPVRLRRSDDAYGGLGFDDALMRFDCGTAMGYAGVGGVNASLFSRGIMTGPIQQLASEDQKREALTAIVSGKVGGALAMTEPSGGSDLARMKTKAVRDGEAG